MQTSPLVSIITTVFNREKYLSETIDSIINQTYQNWELIITDDHSSDRSLQIAINYQDKDTRIKAYKNDSNLGQFANRNHAASLANGKYIKYLDSDDILYPYALEAMVNFIEAFPQAGAAISHDMRHENRPYPVFLTPHEAYRAFYFNQGFPNSGPSAAIINKEIFEKVKGFPSPFYVGTDTNLWLEIAAISGIVKMPPSLNWYRVHEGQAIYGGTISNEYLKQDYLHHLYYLQSPNCPLTATEINEAKRILEKRQLRKIIKLGKKHPLEAIKILSDNKFKLTDLTKAL